MNKYFLFSLSIFCLISCNSSNDTDDNQTLSRAIPVYNQAYNENFETDKIDYILLNASNAYVLIDPFQNNVSESIQAIKANGNQIGAYISIGTGENWRDDFADLQPYVAAEQWAEWPGEYFISTTAPGVIDVMKARIDKIAAWGCDWVEFDNMNWAVYDEIIETYDLEVTREESITYFQELCDYVHQKGMKCMAKNFVESAENFDGVTYESYNNNKNWWKQSGAQSFLDAGKLVIVIHYNEANCNQVYTEYKDIYNADVCYICEDVNLEKYVHYNE